MSKLDEIFDKYNEFTEGYPETTKQQIKELMLGLIGENEVRPESGPKRNGVDQGLRKARNKVRNELRQKVEEL